MSRRIIKIMTVDVQDYEDPYVAAIKESLTEYEKKDYLLECLLNGVKVRQGAERRMQNRKVSERREELRVDENRRMRTYSSTKIYRCQFAEIKNINDIQEKRNRTYEAVEVEFKKNEFPIIEKVEPISIFQSSLPGIVYGKNTYMPVESAYSPYSSNFLRSIKQYENYCHMKVDLPCDLKCQQNVSYSVSDEGRNSVMADLSVEDFTVVDRGIEDTLVNRCVSEKADLEPITIFQQSDMACVFADFLDVDNTTHKVIEESIGQHRQKDLLLINGDDFLYEHSRRNDDDQINDNSSDFESDEINELNNDFFFTPDQLLYVTEIIVERQNNRSLFENGFVQAKPLGEIFGVQQSKQFPVKGGVRGRGQRRGRGRGRGEKSSSRGRYRQKTYVDREYVSTDLVFPKKKKFNSNIRRRQRNIQFDVRKKSIKQDVDKEVIFKDIGRVIPDKLMTSFQWTGDFDLEGGSDWSGEVLNWSFSSNPFQVTTFLKGDKNIVTDFPHVFKYYECVKIYAIEADVVFMNHIDKFVLLTAWAGKDSIPVDSLTNKKMDSLLEDSEHRVMEVDGLEESKIVRFRVLGNQVYPGFRDEDNRYTFHIDGVPTSLFYINCAVSGLKEWPEEVGNVEVRVLYLVEFTCPYDIGLE